MPYQSSVVQIPAILATEFVQVIGYRPGRKALWILGVFPANASSGCTWTPEIFTSGVNTPLNVSSLIPFRVSRLLDGDFIELPWYINGSNSPSAWQVTESWDEVTTTPGGIDVIGVKGTLELPHPVAQGILNKMRQ